MKGVKEGEGGRGVKEEGGWRRKGGRECRTATRTS